MYMYEKTKGWKPRVLLCNTLTKPQMASVIGARIREHDINGLFSEEETKPTKIHLSIGFYTL